MANFWLGLGRIKWHSGYIDEGKVVGCMTLTFYLAFLYCYQNYQQSLREIDASTQKKKKEKRIYRICFSPEFDAQFPHFTAVLGKVKDFLGVISEANKKLELDAKVCIWIWWGKSKLCAWFPFMFSLFLRL